MNFRRSKIIVSKVESLEMRKIKARMIIKIVMLNYMHLEPRNMPKGRQNRNLHCMCTSQCSIVDKVELS